MDGSGWVLRAVEETERRPLGKKRNYLADFQRAYIFALLSRKTGKTVEYERRVGQSVKTPPFHGGMRGSTPLRGTE